MNNKQELQEIFAAAYDRNRWLRKLQDIFGGIEILSHPRLIGQSEAFCQLGSLTTGDEKKLGIFDMEVDAETKLARNRVQLRNLVAKEIGELDGALAAYYDKEDQWRFSYIAIEPTLSSEGELQFQETGSKRYTYLLGKDAQTRTAVNRFADLQPKPTIGELNKAFAVEALNKEFYQKLYKWHVRAQNIVAFPNDEGIDKTTHTINGLIRLLTRVLFVWFLKEKGLISPKLFDKQEVEQRIDWNRSSSFYKAILQNLFFATLNRGIEDRSFRTTTQGKANSNNYLITNVYRYQDYFKDKDKGHIVELFTDTPFLNGGLFECLDREATDEEKKAYAKNKSIRNEKNAIRIDGFSDRDDNRINLPNELFFNDDEQQLGLINLLGQYQFTAEESAPLDIEVALDPELLGKVFENLLAAHDPETGEIARSRRRSGSYYTPRGIVSYMVDESLKAYLAKSIQSGNSNTQLLDKLFDAADGTGELDTDVNSSTKDVLIKAISDAKIIDPAVGSGAFPMGVLQRMVGLLSILDPNNKKWKAQQLERLPDLHSIEQDLKTAGNINDQQARHKAKEELQNRKQEVIDLFKKQDHNYLRKLYLIENCIFGVDNQPIAIQIAKLRFFISLVIEQQPTSDASDNYGIKPLPHLETRFVSADTLIPLKKKKEMLSTERAEDLKRELQKNRAKHVRATTRQLQRQCLDKDKKLREKLQAELEQSMHSDEARKIASWNSLRPETKAADWFDAEYMFGIPDKDRFDIVIGNPPYVPLQKNSSELGKRYKNADFETFMLSGDIYQLFYEKGCKLLKPQCGLLSYITSNSWMRAKCGKKLRKFFSSKHTPLRLIDMKKDVFDSATVDPNILIMMEGKHNQPGKAVDIDRLPTCGFPPEPKYWTDLRTDGDKPWSILSPEEHAIKTKIERIGRPLKEWDIRINYGIKTGYNPAFIIDNQTKEALIATDPKSSKIIKPILRGRDIQRYHSEWAGLWLIDSHNGYDGHPPIDIEDYPAIKAYLDKFYLKLKKRQDKGVTPYNLRNCNYHEEFAKEKIVWIELVNQGRFAYDNEGVYCEATTFIMTGENIKYLCAILNSKLIHWFLSQIAPTSGMGTLRWKKVYVEMIPIPAISESAQQPFTELVDQILTAQTDSSKIYCATLETQLNQLIYQLYGLTAEQTKIIENIQ